MEDASIGKPALTHPAERCPCQTPTTLATSSERVEPQPLESCLELTQTAIVARYRKVLAPASIHHLQPCSHLLQRPMSLPLEFHFDRFDLGLEFLPCRFPVDRVTTCPGFAAEMRKAQEVERVRRVLVIRFPLGGRSNTEFD